MAMSIQQVQRRDEDNQAMFEAIKRVKPRLRKGLFHIWHCSNEHTILEVEIYSDAMLDPFTTKRKHKVIIPAKEGQGYGPDRAFDAWRRNLLGNLRSPQ